MFESNIRLNSLYLLNLIRRQLYFTNYQDSFKSRLYQVFLQVDVLAKKRNNKYQGVHFLVKLQAVGYLYISIFLRFPC